MTDDRRRYGMTRRRQAPPVYRAACVDCGKDTLTTEDVVRCPRCQAAHANPEYVALARLAYRLDWLARLGEVEDNTPARIHSEM